MRSPDRHRVSRAEPPFWITRAVNAVSRLFARGRARLSLRTKPSREAAFFVDQLNLAVRLIPRERLEDFMENHVPPGESERARELRLHLKAMCKESEALKQIRTSAGEDTEAEIAGYRQYISEHPNNDFAFGCLGT